MKNLFENIIVILMIGIIVGIIPALMMTLIQKFPIIGIILIIISIIFFGKEIMKYE